MSNIKKCLTATSASSNVVQHIVSCCALYYCFIILFLIIVYTLYFCILFFPALTYCIIYQYIFYIFYILYSVLLYCILLTSCTTFLKNELVLCGNVNIRTIQWLSHFYFSNPVEYKYIIHVFGVFLWDQLKHLYTFCILWGSGNSILETCNYFDHLVSQDEKASLKRC